MWRVTSPSRTRRQSTGARAGSWTGIADTAVTCSKVALAGSTIPATRHTSRAFTRSARACSRRSRCCRSAPTRRTATARAYQSGRCTARFGGSWSGMDGTDALWHLLAVRGASGRAVAATAGVCEEAGSERPDCGGQGGRDAGSVEGAGSRSEDRQAESTTSAR